MFLFVLSSFGYFCMHQIMVKRTCALNITLIDCYCSYCCEGVSKESKLTLSQCIFELVNSYLKFVFPVTFKPLFEISINPQQQ